MDRRLTEGASIVVFLNSAAIFYRKLSWHAKCKNLYSFKQETFVTLPIFAYPKENIICFSFV